jgi:hypothetical protein
MGRLKLAIASSEMAEDVSFVLAIPLLEPENNYTSPRPVAGVIYVDSTTKGFFIEDRDLAVIVSIAQKFLDGLVLSPPEAFGRVRNFPLSRTTTRRSLALNLPKAAKPALQLIQIPPPRASEPFQINYDYSDFAPAQIRRMV